MYAAKVTRRQTRKRFSFRRVLCGRQLIDLYLRCYHALSRLQIVYGWSAQMHLFDKVDGEIRYRQQGPDRSLISADIPWTRIDAAGLAALREVKSLRSISLSGIHFPSTFMDADALRAIGDGSRCELLAVHGAGLLPAELKVLVALAPSLASLDLAGLPVSESLLSEILDAAPGLQQLSIGLRAQPGGAPVHSPANRRPCPGKTARPETHRAPRLTRHRDYRRPLRRHSAATSAGSRHR